MNRKQLLLLAAGGLLYWWLVNRAQARDEALVQQARDEALVQYAETGTLPPGVAVSAPPSRKMVTWFARYFPRSNYV